MVLSALLSCTLQASDGEETAGESPGTVGWASWYGAEHRGKLMANGRKFDPDKLTAASWFFPLGTQVRVTSATQPQRNVIVTITDRGPAKRLIDKGRVIDLSWGAFKVLAAPERGLVEVRIDRVELRDALHKARNSYSIRQAGVVH